MRFLRLILSLALLAVSPAAGDETIRIFDEAVIHWNPDVRQETDGDYVVRYSGQAVDRRVTLPSPSSAAETPRITAVIDVEPVFEPGAAEPNDKWNRLGGLSVFAPKVDDPDESEEIELVRFVSGYGGACHFEQDLTSFGPRLAGPCTLRITLGSYSELPGWRVSVSLRYETGDAGIRRPVLVEPIFRDEHVITARSKLRTQIIVPEGVEQPRLRILTTGHATDGQGGNEFVTCVHVLSVDGKEVCSWRPWVSGDPGLREANPWAGRQKVDGREIWASDFDRSGWQPSLAVEPFVIPVPELDPGPHRIELRILGIRKAADLDPDGHHGYWSVSAVLLGDEPWPVP